MAGSLVFANGSLRKRAVPSGRQFDRSRLWSHGISGDLPILMAEIDRPRAGTFVNELVKGHEFCFHRGLEFDLILVDRHLGSVKRLAKQFEEGPGSAQLGKPGGIHILSAEILSRGDLSAISAAARIMVFAGSGPLAAQLAPKGLVGLGPAARNPRPDVLAQATPSSARSLLCWNGLGGFSPDGHEYITVTGGAATRTPSLPPAPWTNVLANPEFGCLTTESRPGLHLVGQQSDQQTTPWANDPVSDTPGEVIYLRDNETGEVWTPTPLPLGGGCSATVRHGQGYTVYESQGAGLTHELTVFVPLDSPIKVMRLRLTNPDWQPRNLSAIYFADLVLGSFRDEAPMQVVCSRDLETGAVLARRRWADDFGTRVAFASSYPDANSVTTEWCCISGQARIGGPASSFGEQPTTARPRLFA